MTNKELIALLQAGKVEEFNQFRVDNPNFIPDFRGADFFGIDLSYANLSYANFSNADLTSANLINANLKLANLYCVKINKQQLTHLIFVENADFHNADLFRDNFNKMLQGLLGIEVLEA